MGRGVYVGRGGIFIYLGRGVYVGRGGIFIYLGRGVYVGRGGIGGEEGVSGKGGKERVYTGCG